MKLRNAPNFPAWSLRAALLAMIAPGAACGRSAEVVGRARGGNFSQLAVAGDRLLANDGTTLVVFDVSDRRKPRELGRLETPDVMGAITFVEAVPYAEIGIRFRQLETEPSSVDQQWIEAGWLSVDDRSYSKGYFVGVSNLVRLDLADPSRPVVVPAVNLTPADTLASRLGRMVVAGRRLYASDATMGSLVFDVADPQMPRQLSAFPRGRALAPAEPFLYVADGAGVIVSDAEGQQVFPGGLQVLDISDPAAPKEVGRLDGDTLGRGGEGANVGTVAVSGRHVYLGATIVKGGGWGGADSFLVTVDGGEPARPREIGREKLDGGVLDLALTGSTLYARLDSGKLAVYDLADPARPRRARTLSLPSDTLTSLVAEPWLYVGHTGGLAILDLRR